jgi:uncharacterized membrane protein
MNTGRVYHAAALLPSGEVLIVGGESSLFPATCLSSAELYNPSHGTFSYTGSLTTAMCNPTATTLQDGRVLVTSGATAELYDPSTGAFSVTGSLQVSRAGASATLLGNGKVLFAGGNNGSGSIVCPSYLHDCNTVTSAELYDPSTGTFTLTGSMQASRFDQTATLMSNGEVLIAGGAYIDPIPNPPGPPQFYTFSRNEAELYNPATGTFTVTSTMNVARAYHVAALLPSGKVLVATGYGTPTAEIYDPSTKTFTLSAANLNDERDSGAQAVLLDSGVVLVLAGEWNVGVSRPIFWNTAELFDATTPNFTLSVTPASYAVALGTPASFTVTVAPTNGFAGNVSLSAPPPSEATATLSTNTIPNGSGTSTLTVTPTSSNTPGIFNYYAGVTATSGSLTHSVSVTLEVNSLSTPDFSLNTTPASQTVLPGNGTSYALSLTPSNGFASNVSLSVGGLPAGANATFNKNPVPKGSGTSTLTVTTPSSTAPGNYTLTITGTSGSLTHSAAVTLVVNAASTPDFSLSATPASQTVAPGNGTSYTLTLTPSNGFASNVSLSLGTLPAGVNATFNTNPVLNGSGTSTLTVTTTSSTAPGNYTLTINGTSGSLTHSATVALVVNAASTPDFSLSATPASQTVVQGNGTSFTSTLTPSNGFAGTVSLSLGALPAGVNATFNTNPITNGSGTSTLTVTTTSSTALGTYTLTITGTSGSLTHSTSVTLIVRRRRSG